jgi:hypothetical protein
MSFPFVQPYFGLGNSLQTAQAGGAGGPSVGGWVELARHTLGSEADLISVASLPDKRYYMILWNTIRNGAIDHIFRTNNDSGGNYSYRRSQNGGADGTGVSSTHGCPPYMGSQNAGGNDAFGNVYVSNLAGKEKLAQGHAVTTQAGAGAGSAPRRQEAVGKWANTSVAANRFDMINGDSGGYNTGSEMVVLGWDPTDTHTSNFWEELDSTTTTTSGTIQSGTFTAKKYLMYQIVGKKASGSGSGSSRFQFNGDTGSNYAQRNSINGTDYAYANQASANIGGDGNTAGEMAMFTGFIINNAGTEKLFLGHSAFGNTAGAGQIGNRGEIACKWANTSAQITSIHCMNLNFDAGAIMKIWGSD